MLNGLKRIGRRILKTRYLFLLQEKYPNRWLPKFGYMPYLLVWAAAPLYGMGRDFIQCAYLADQHPTCILSP